MTADPDHPTNTSDGRMAAPGHADRTTGHPAEAETQFDESASHTECESRYGHAAPQTHSSTPSRMTGLTTTQLRALPAAFPFDPVVPAAFGISRSAAYRALTAGELPITPLRLGRRLIVKRSELLTALGITDHPDPTPDDRPHITHDPDGVAHDHDVWKGDVDR